MKLKTNRGCKAHMKKAAKNYGLLQTSWSVQTKLFFEQSTLHGVRYIAETGRPFIEKFMWFVCVTVGAIASMIIIVSLWKKFQTNPTITGLDTDFHSWDVPFPAITICQSIPSNASNIDDYIKNNIQDPENYEDVLLFLTKLTQLSYSTIEEMKPFYKKDYIPKDSNLKGVAFELMNKCEDIFENCAWKSNKYNCCDGFFPVFTENGFCYSYNSRHYETKIPGAIGMLPIFQMQYIKETDLKWSLKFSVKSFDEENKIPIYILNSDEVPGVDIKPQHIWDYKVDRISFSVKQTYTTDDARQLSIKQRRCTFSDEIKLKVDYLYTYSACTQQCRMETAMKKCNCVPHFYPEVDHFRHCKIYELECIAKYVKEIMSVDKCYCELGCSNTVYEVEKLNEKSSHDEFPELEAEFVSWPMVRYKREVLFGWVDLLVSFGGIAGLFLGFSLLSGVEVLYYFTIRACCMVYKEKDELEKIKRDQANTARTDYDLSLVPYFVRDPLPGKGINEIAKEYNAQNLNNFKNAFDYCNAKFCLEIGIPHTVCTYKDCKFSVQCSSPKITTIDENGIAKILHAMNTLRNKVATGQDTRGGNSQAANMKALSYDEDLAYVAQCWANQCIAGHDQCRSTERFEMVGQNIAMFSGVNDVDEILTNSIDLWYEEIVCINDRNMIDRFYASENFMKQGHFTQLVWASTSHVGCALITYGKGMDRWTNLICNYGPSGNIEGESIYIRGEPCTLCSSDEQCSKEYTGLCRQLRTESKEQSQYVSPITPIYKDADPNKQIACNSSNNIALSSICFILSLLCVTKNIS